MTAASLPLVSCVMATSAARRAFLRQALRCYARQSYARRELLIVDDPDAAAEDLAGGLAGVRVIRTAQRLTLGAKLNIAIEAAQGEIIQKLDDDDYYHPQFIASTAGALLAGGGEDCVVACRSFLVLHAESGALKRWDAGFAGGTLCFYRRRWLRQHFAEVNLGEDQQFANDPAVTRVGLENPELYILVRHGAGHAWTHLASAQRSATIEVSAGDAVNEAVRRLPDYAKSLRECVAPEDLGFYQSLAAAPS